jgi:hypothetical protein
MSPESGVTKLVADPLNHGRLQPILCRHNNIMQLSLDEFDEINEIQYNLRDDTEIDAAIDELSDEQLVVLHQGCLASVKRQRGIIARVEERLSRN